MNASFFRIKVAQEPSAWTVSLSGDVDYAASIELAPKLAEIADQCEADLIFDLSRVTLIDSEGIKVMIAVFACMQRKHGNMRISKCSRTAARVLRLVGVDQMLGVNAV